MEINGDFTLCNAANSGALTIHQYNTNSALTIHTRIHNNTSTRLIKTGPGELVLTHTNSPFSGLYAYEGVVTFPAIANANVNSPVGRGVNNNDYSFLLGDATLRYKGTDPAGHETDRQIRLRGFGVIEASGVGPLTFTRNPGLIVQPDSGRNQLLTLSGTGRGFIEGPLDLRGGRLRKRGSGTWTLAETSHSPAIIWGAEIFDGTLVVNGTLGRDVTVHTNGTLAGKGTVKRDLHVNDGGTLALDPDEVLTVGKNLYLADDARITLPRKLPGVFMPVLNPNISMF